MNKEQNYYTVFVYKHSGIGQEATIENVLACSLEEAMARVAGSKPWLRNNPMYAFKQEKRVGRNDNLQDNQYVPRAMCRCIK